MLTAFFLCGVNIENQGAHAWLLFHSIYAYDYICIYVFLCFLQL